MRGKILSLITDVTEIFSAACLFIIAGIVIAQVIMRYFFHRSFVWAEEVVLMAFSYLVFIGIGAAYARRKHMYVDALLNILPKTIAKVTNSVVLGLCSVFLLVMIYEMIRTIVISSRTGMTTPVLELPMATFYLPVLIGGPLFLIQVMRRFRNLG